MPIYNTKKYPTQSRSLEQHDVSKKAFSDKPLVYACLYD